MLYATKGLLHSSGAVGAITAIIAGSASLFLKLDPQQAASVLETSTQLVTVGLQVITVVGSAISLYGRIVATKRITIAGKLPAP